MQKTKTIKADPGNSGDNMGNSSRKGKDSWTNVYDVFSNVLDRNTIQVKNLSETITELDALKNLTQNASTSVLKAVTTFIEGRVRQKKFLSPDQINIQIRKIMDAESLLLETRREVETIDEGLTVDSLREIRKRFSRAVNRSESLSMDIKNDRTLLSELEEAITLALKKARAEVQLSAARKEASSSAHEFEALTTVRRKLLSAIKKAQSVGIDVSSEMSYLSENGVGIFLISLASIDIPNALALRITDLPTLPTPITPNDCSDNENRGFFDQTPDLKF